MSTGRRSGGRGGARSAPRKREGARKPSAAPPLEERLAGLQRWHRWRYYGPQSTGLSRMQQWVSAYAEGLLEPSDQEPPGPAGVIVD
jgi:hypothetical protein